MARVSSWVTLATMPNQQNIIHGHIPFSTTKLFFFRPKTTTPRLKSTRRRTIICNAVVNTTEVIERQKLKKLFQEARERCWEFPMEGVSFSFDDFHSALERYDFVSEFGSKVTGTVFNVDNNGALVDINAKSFAILPVYEASILKIKHVGESGIRPGMQEEFVIVGQNEDDSLTLSLREIQYDLAWERCYQLQAGDAVLKGKVVGPTKGGFLAVVEGLRGFIPFSHLLSKSAAEELTGKEIPLKILEVNKDKSKLVLSNRKAIADSYGQIETCSVVLGTVQSIRPYGAFIDIGGKSGLLHVSQISHDRISDVSTVLQPGDILKVMILSHNKEKNQISFSTKKLEPTPGDMVRNPKLVFEKAEEMARIFRKRIAQAEAMARSDMLRFQPESRLTLNSDGSLGPFGNDLPSEKLDWSEIPSAVDDSFINPLNNI